MEIKKLDANLHLEEYNDLLRYAFQVTEKQLLDYGWENNDIRQSKFPVLKKARVFGYFDENRLASQFAVYPLKMNVYGNILNVGWITSVATYPEYTGQGLMSKLMLDSLKEMRERGESLAILYPFSIPLYRHRGWEIISDKMTFVIKDNQLPTDLEVDGYVRRVDDDNKDMIALHNKFASKTHGCLQRNELAWEEYWRWDVDDTTVAVYYNQDDIATGYMVYLIKDNVMHIKEMIYLDSTAWQGLWKYIAAHESMVEEVSGANYSNESIAFWFRDSDIKETIRPYIMGRIVDIKQFLTQYRFINIIDKERLTINLKDPFLEWNNGSFSIEINECGNCEFVDGKSDNEITLDIGTLTTLLFSYKTPAYLHRLERIEASNKTLEFLDRIIYREKAYISDYI